MQTVSDIREFFIGELHDEAFTLDKTGQNSKINNFSQLISFFLF